MKIVGHRGARGVAPENTIDGIKHALTLHPDLIEVDVRVTKDGVCVLHHDTLLTADGLLVSRHTLEELREHKPDLATLEEAITAIGRKVPIIIEVKPGVFTDPVVELLGHYLEKGWKSTDFYLESFSQKTLRKLHAALPEFRTIVAEHISGFRAAWRARELDTKYLMFNQRNLWGGFIRMMTKRGWKLGAYTVNDVAKAERWAKDGLFLVVTDDPGQHKPQAKS